MLKRIFSLILACAMLLMCCNAALANEVQWPTLAERAKMETKIEKLTDEPVTLTVWFDLGAHDVTDVIPDLQELPLLKALEEKTGIHLELIVPPVGEAESNFSLMLTSGKYADIIIGFNSFYSMGADAAIEEGIILDLTDLVEKYAPHYNAVRTATNYRIVNTVTDNGYMPYFCNISYADALGKTYGGPIIRQDVLDKLGMDTPVTFDDWHEFLTRAKNELGMTRGFGIANGGIAKYNAFNTAFGFGMNDPAQGGDFYVVDGKVCYGPLSEGYLPYVTLMRDWYAEGLLDPDFTSTITFDDGVAMMSSDLCAATSEHGGVLDFINGLGKSVNPDFNFTPIADPVLEEGQQLHYGFINGGSPIGKAAAITTACKNPELAVRFLDQLYTDEGFMLCNYGIEGESYVLDENGVPQFTDLIMNNPQGTPTHMMCAYAAHISWPFEGVFGRDDVGASLEYAATWDANNDYSYSYPGGVTPTKEENEVYGDYYPDIKTYTDEMTVRFIMGLEPLENYDAFVEQLHTLGIDEVLASRQSAYDRYMERASK